MLTHRSPCKSHHYTRRSITVQSIRCKYRLANEISEVVAGDIDSVGLAFHQLICRFTKYLQTCLLTGYLPVVN